MLRISLFVTSAVNIAAGVLLASLYVIDTTGGVPLVVFLIGFSMFVQGAFTVGYLRDWWRDFGEGAPQLFVAGECAAALVGTLGTLQGILYNLHPVNGDQEFGPLMAAALIGTHAVLGLIYAARNEKFPARQRG